MERTSHHPTIDQLIPLLRERDFDDLFERLTQGESSNGRFLLKMEIKRLCTPCRRVIDMRAYLGDECQLFEYQGIQHAMPPEAIALFHSQCYLYRDSYTLGVYEALQQWLKRQGHRAGQQQPEPSPRAQLEAKRVPFASYYSRSDERMHYSSQVLLKFNDGQRLFAKTSDISLSGTRVQIPFPLEHPPGEIIEVYFTGLEHDHPQEALHHPVHYQLLGHDERNGRHWLRLLKVASTPEFDAFLQQFIDSNKSRYRISVDYLLSAALTKGYEQYFLPRMSGLPLFFRGHANPRLDTVLRTENNQGILSDWRDEKNRDMLAGLFPPARMAALLAQPDNQKETLIYSFTHSVRSHIYFFSATREELDRSGLRALFFQVGARRSSWRVYRLLLEPCRPQEAEIASLLPHREPHPQDHLLHERVSQISHVGLLQPVDNELIRDDYLQYGATGHNANELQCFGHPVEVEPFEIETLYYLQLRSEPRYSHRTAVAVQQGEKSYLGWSRDISVQGLCLEMEQGVPCQRGEVLHIALPRLQALSKNMELRQLPYRVVGLNSNGTVLHLCIEGAAETHVGRQFFALLIESNLNKLKEVREGRRYRGYAKALRNLYAHHLFTHPFYINRLKQGPRVTAIAHAGAPRSLDALLAAQAEQEGNDNLTPLLAGERFKLLVQEPLRDRQREDTPLEQELYVALWQEKTGGWESDAMLLTAFPDAAARRAFVTQALTRGRFFSVRMMLSRTGRPDIHFIGNELDYIAKFAIHKAKQLEEELWSVIGLGELIDTTAATLAALGLSAPAAP